MDQRSEYPLVATTLPGKRRKMGSFSGIEKREIVALLSGIILCACASHLRIYIPQTYSSILPAIVIILFFGINFGPWIGFVVGGVGTFIDTFVSIHNHYDLWVLWNPGGSISYVSLQWNYYLANAMIGLLIGLVIIGMRVRYSTKMHFSIVELCAMEIFSALFVFLCLLLFYGSVKAPVRIVIPGLIWPTTLFSCILLPILLFAYNAIIKRKSQDITEKQEWQPHVFLFSGIMLMPGFGVMLLPTGFRHGILLGTSFNLLFYIGTISVVNLCIASFIRSRKGGKGLEQQEQQVALRPKILPSNPIETDAHALPLPTTIRMQPDRTLAGFATRIFVGLLMIACVCFPLYIWLHDWPVAMQEGAPLYATLICLLFDATFFTLFIFGFAYLMLAFPRQQLIVSESGLACRLNNRSSSISWQEAKSFSIITLYGAKKDKAPQFYELCSADVVIRWAAQPVSGGSAGSPPIMGIKGSGMAQPYPSLAVYSQQMQALLQVIAAHTGLPLYDLR